MVKTYIDSDGSELTVEQNEDVGIVEYTNAAGERHRLDGPAIEYANGDKDWYQKNKLHRLDGPACEYVDGRRDWYQKNKLHRLDGPAIEWANGSKEWFVEGVRHRLDGPAFDCPDGYKEWWVEGKQVEPLFLVTYWLERGRCCWFDESTQNLCFSDP